MFPGPGPPPRAFRALGVEDEDAGCPGTELAAEQAAKVLRGVRAGSGAGGARPPALLVRSVRCAGRSGRPRAGAPGAARAAGQQAVLLPSEEGPRVASKGAADGGCLIKTCLLGTDACVSHALSCQTRPGRPPSTAVRLPSWVLLRPELPGACHPTSRYIPHPRARGSPLSWAAGRTGPARLTELYLWMRINSVFMPDLTGRPPPSCKAQPVPLGLEISCLWNLGTRPEICLRPSPQGSGERGEADDDNGNITPTNSNLREWFLTAVKRLGPRCSLQDLSGTSRTAPCVSQTHTAGSGPSFGRAQGVLLEADLAFHGGELPRAARAAGRTQTRFSV